MRCSAPVSSRLASPSLAVRSSPQHHTTRRNCHCHVHPSPSLHDTAASDARVVGRRCHLLSLGLAGFLLPSYQAQAKQSPGEWSSPGLAAEENPDMPKFFKTASGVKVQELALGTGDLAAHAGDTLLFDYVLRRANGYFIYSTIEGVSFQPKDVPVGPVSFRLGGDSKLIPGLQEVLTGMKRNGKRRALIPASSGYRRGGDGVDIYCSDAEPQPPTFATKRQLQSHCNEPLLLEVELLRITPAA